MSEVELEFLGDRRFAHTEPVQTAYGAAVKVYESSSAEGPHIWLNIEQPPPAYGGALPEAKATAHMTLRQAEEIHARLGKLIEYAKETWDESCWYNDEPS